MRSLILIGSGWHPKLFRAEVKAIIGPIETLHPRIVFVTQKESTLNRISDTSLVDDTIHSSCRFWPQEGESSLSEQELATYIYEWSEKHLPPGKFAVRARRLGKGINNLSCRTIESSVGELISSESNKVNLENPDSEIVVILAGSDDASSHYDDIKSGDLIVWGIRDNLARGNYAGISPTERPFFKPVTLDPKLARLMISLSNRGDIQQTIVDPFCGTGGIAIEAKILGLDVLASDLDPEMVEGTKENLSWSQGTGNYWVNRSPANQIDSIWGIRENCSFVFDPPYGRNAWTSEESLSVFLGALSSARKMCQNGSVCTILPTVPDALDRLELGQITVMGRKWEEIVDEIRATGWAVFFFAPIRVHRSLSRLVVVCHPAD